MAAVPPDQQITINLDTSTLVEETESGVWGGASWDDVIAGLRKEGLIHFNERITMIQVMRTGISFRIKYR